MKIEIWSDFTCPYCFLGKRQFDLALELFEHKDAIELEFKSYEMDPWAREADAIGAIELLMQKYKMTKEQAFNMMEDIRQQGNEIGLDICFDEIVHANTFQAHRLVKFSNENQKAHSLIDLLFHSYFVRKENIGKRQVLHRLAEEAGLDPEEADAFLCLNKYAKAVKSDEQLAEELGITVVPFFIFNEELAVAGAQSAEVFTSVLNELWEEESKTNNRNKTKGISYCTGNDCDVD